MLIFIMISFN